MTHSISPWQNTEVTGRTSSYPSVIETSFQIHLALPLPPLPPVPEATLLPLLANSPARDVLKSPCNKFGLFRQYYATHFPEHDPDEHTTSDDLLDSSSASLVELIHPYPNLSSFLLGEWYWNDGLKKSQSSFANLLNIVGHLDYQPEDVWNVNWRTIDANLGGNPESRDVDDGWEDEQASDSGPVGGRGKQRKNRMKE